MICILFVSIERKLADVLTKGQASTIFQAMITSWEWIISIPINIAHNLVQHDRIKYVEIDRHFVKEKLESGLICILFVSFERKLLTF